MKRFFLLFFFLILLFSCQLQGVYQSAEIIEKIEKPKFIYIHDKYISPKYKDYYRKLYESFFKTRSMINTFIAHKKIQNFVLIESFNIDSYSGNPIYSANIYSSDSIYVFTYKAREVKSYCFTDEYIPNFIRKGDSIFIYKEASIKNYDLDKNPSYFSNYKNGKLDQLTYNDSIIYKKKGSKMVVDLKKLKGFYHDYKTGETIEYK